MARADKKLVIGILAHVDAGKTSLTEAMLYTSGATRSRGSVDKGSAVTDGMAMERNRGISIKAASARLAWKEHEVYIVDTPGHIDFSAEVDRALFVLDVVVLVVSAVEGIQAHTLNLWESIRERGIPCLVFVNKIDRAGANIEAVFNDLENELGVPFFALNYVNQQQSEATELLAFNELDAYTDEALIAQSLENLAEQDEAFMSAFLEGDLPSLSSIQNTALPFIKALKLYPILFGSAKLDLGITEVLDFITTAFHTNQQLSEAASAKIFKIEYLPRVGRLAHCRLYSGRIRSKDNIWSQQLAKEIKINQIFKPKLGKLEAVDVLEANEIGMITTSEAIPAGDILGQTEFRNDFNQIGQAVLQVQVKAEDEQNYHKLADALELLNTEDPTLAFEWHKEKREFHLKILGPMQTEVLKDSLLERFDIAADFLKPKVVYKETPKQTAEGFVRYWMPKPCWAIMRFRVEAGALGSGVVFESNVRTSDIAQKYQNEVKRAIPWSLRQGIKGWEVTDLKITLLEGEDHTMHSNPGDFLLATPMGIMRALENADTELLEPMYRFHIKAKQELLGAIASDLNRMNALIDTPLFDGDFFTLTGKVAVEKAMDYGIQFNATTSGKGRLKLSIEGYQKTITEEHKIRAFQGVSPLDESQWILHNRGAFKADERIR